MPLQLRQPAKKLAVSAVLSLLAAAYLILTTTAFLAAHFSADPDLEHLQRAARLDPGNAEYPYRLGRYELLAAQSPQAAIPWLEKATSLNPHSARYWLDLAIARQSVGDTDSERPALERALAADPRTPDVAWQAANLYLAQGSSDAAMREFRVVMQNDPSLTSQAISLCWKMHPDIDSFQEMSLPQPPRSGKKCSPLSNLSSAPFSSAICATSSHIRTSPRPRPSGSKPQTYLD
jgi:tetratricopeptide (TPR) repeat protein